MPLVGFEPTIPAFRRGKTVHALDRAATVNDTVSSGHIQRWMIYCLMPKFPENIRRKATLYTTNRTWPDLESKQGRRGGKLTILC
jgi:hypothetical protein